MDWLTLVWNLFKLIGSVATVVLFAGLLFGVIEIRRTDRGL